MIAVASATIGVIRNNQPLLDAVENTDTSDDDEVGLVVIVANTLNTASWLIFLAVCVIIGEIIAVILLLMNVETGRVVLSVLVSYYNECTVVSLLNLHNAAGDYLQLHSCILFLGQWDCMCDICQRMVSSTGRMY